jgi:hypothetical protein
MKYTEQKDIDEIKLGARWACRFLNFINAGEHSRTRQADRSEINQILAEAFRARLADMCNYIDHDNRDMTADDVVNWNTDNPEWHYWVRKQMDLLNVVSDALSVAIDPRRYQTGIMLTQYNTHHYVLITYANQIVNPDPALKGEIIEYRKLIY